MIEAPVEATAPPHPEHDRGLLLIGLFKLAKSAFFFVVGLGALHLVHKDLGDEMMRLIVLLKRDPEGRLVTLLMNQVDAIDARHLREIGFGAFSYAALALVEGWGLMAEKVWAEYLTLTLTVMFLPWELYELVRRPTAGHWSLLLSNLAVLAYILWLLSLKRRTKTEAALQTAAPGQAA